MRLVMILEESSVTLDIRDEFSSNILPRKTRKKNIICVTFTFLTYFSFTRGTWFSR
ncbi:hypothetical protein OIU79_009018 [Salix purpurea]|uniref:Uncharacterized protein n=1 Tax=Salix purpurea TaxID=77065 RepID=A0A9Q0TJQ8_SALPP|nr:hypothetical protein OIU79_009018 [Salix purpurea]